MPQLDEPAVIFLSLAVALDQLERTARQHLVRVLRKHASQTLLAEIEDRDEVLVRTDPAAGDPTNQASTLSAVGDRTPTVHGHIVAEVHVDRKGKPQRG